jgi:hypothetical protein
MTALCLKSDLIDNYRVGQKNKYIYIKNFLQRYIFLLCYLNFDFRKIRVPIKILLHFYKK